MLCPQCGKEVPGGTRFCASCGGNLTTGTAPPPPAPIQPPGFTPVPPPRKNHLAIWMAILAVLFVGGVAVLLIFLLSGDKGMSVESYRDQVNQIIEDSHSQLDLIPWEELDPSTFDQQAVDDFEQMSEDLQDVLPEFEDALAELEAIEPPGQAAGLHQDILDYYGDSVAVLKDTEIMAKYAAGIARAGLAMESGMETLASKITNASSEQEFMTLMDQMIGVMDGFIVAAEGLKPPSFMSDFNTTLVTSMKELRGIFTEMKKAVASGNLAALEAIQAKAEKAESNFDSKVSASLDEMYRFFKKLDALEQDLQDLTDQLDAL